MIAFSDTMAPTVAEIIRTRPVRRPQRRRSLDTCMFCGGAATRTVKRIKDGALVDVCLRCYGTCRGAMAVYCSP